ncbi:MAG: glycoside hydrolase family 92 protein [Bacteroidetes bacterium]|nr:glycoside hydrolase family 92 protein [Bacteroidota bacterium]MBT6685395.1 glycoside hydrolase family 92 protein [Bacteroidota bacterium]MBT7141799.1 glycoside hydrolase family 92 protein [Bacteroidota bacterium]
MIYAKGILYFILSLFISCSSPNKSAEIEKFSVNPFIGTGGHGHTYPGVCSPFGMVQLSPDTRLDGWDGCSAYHYSDSVVYGFSHTHLSGTGCSDYGDILLMPTTGKPSLNNEDYASKFSHKNEKATAGYYSTKLNDYGIIVELTATQRAGFHKYTFPESEKSNIIIDLDHRDKVLDAEIEILSDTEIAGKRISRAWANEQHVYFVAKFSKAFTNSGISIDEEISAEAKKAEGKNLKAFVSFSTKENEEVLLKIGLSAVSVENARKNLDAEIPEWNFEKIKTQVKSIWGKELGKIIVEGGTQNQQTVFYTALYHSMLAPNIFMDINGQYRGRDLNIHQAKNFENYTVFSLWDTYRATHPLFTIIDQKRTNDFIQTFIKQYEQGGMLPVWELSANETGCMIGYHSIPVIADAFMKGIKDYDVEKAFEAMINSAEQDHLGLEFYKEKGYIPGNKEGESVSKTLEYAYDDWCIAKMAKELGKEDIYIRYIERAQSYKNIFDASTGFMRAKHNECWKTPFEPREVDFNFTEANSWQYSFYVPQDISGLIKYHGGKQKLEAKLDELFSANSETTGREQSDITGLIGQYAHGNEPSHHMAYLYNYLNSPWKTQKIVRQIMDEMYTAKPDGLCGNEDCGQMSSWYVLSAMGFYPVTPASNIYAIGTPIFPVAKINLENGKQFIIKANNVSNKKIYIQSAKLNGKDFTKTYISHFQIMEGGELVFEMGAEANKNWGSLDADIPVAAINEHLIMPLPFAKAEKTFSETTELLLGSITEAAKIYFTLDGSEPNLNSQVFIEKIILTETTTLKAFAHHEKLGKSKDIEAKFFKIRKDRKVSYLLNDKPIDEKSETRPYSTQYTGGGDLCLIDQIRGSSDFKTGEWQGFHEIDVNVVVDLSMKQKIKTVGIGCLQDIKSWIFMPIEIQVFTSNDGIKYSYLTSIKNDVNQKTEGGITKDFTANVNTEARFIKVVAKNMGMCPEWHIGYEHNGKGWIFVDEIIVN